MSRRLDKLLDELGLDRGERNKMPGIQTQNIKKRVNDALNAVPKEREVYMRQKILKSAAVALTVVVLGVTSAFAAINFDVLKELFFVRGHLLPAAVCKNPARKRQRRAVQADTGRNAHR